MSQQIPVPPPFHGVPPPPPSPPMVQPARYGDRLPPMPAQGFMMDPIVDQFDAMNMTPNLPNTNKTGVDMKPPQLGKVPNTYTGWTLRKAEPLSPSDEPNWSRVQQIDMLLPPEQLLKIVKANGKTVKEDYKALGSDNQRKQVDRLLEEQKYMENNPNAEWKLASIERELKRSGRREVKTQAIHVVLKRQNKSPATPKKDTEASKQTNAAVKTVNLKDPFRPPQMRRASTSANFQYGRQAQQVPSGAGFSSRLPSYAGPMGMPPVNLPPFQMPQQNAKMPQQASFSGLGFQHPAAPNQVPFSAPAAQQAAAPGPQLPPLFGAGPFPPRFGPAMNGDGFPFIEVIEEQKGPKVPHGQFMQPKPQKSQQGWPNGFMNPPLAPNPPMPAQKMNKTQQPQPPQQRRPSIKLNQPFNLAPQPTKANRKSEAKVQDWYSPAANIESMDNTSSEDEDDGSSTFSEYTPPTTPDVKTSMPGKNKASGRRGSLYTSSPEVPQQPIYREHRKARPEHQRHGSHDSKGSSSQSSARYHDVYVETIPERTEGQRRRTSVYEAPPSSRRHSFVQRPPSRATWTATSRPYIHQRSRTDDLYDSHASRYREAYDDPGLYSAYRPRSPKRITVGGERRRYYDDAGYGRRREGEYRDRDRIALMGLREEELDRRERERTREAERIAQVLRDRELEAKIDRTMFEEKLRREKEDVLFRGRYW